MPLILILRLRLIWESRKLRNRRLCVYLPASVTKSSCAFFYQPALARLARSRRVSRAIFRATRELSQTAAIIKFGACELRRVISLSVVFGLTQITRVTRDHAIHIDIEHQQHWRILKVSIATIASSDKIQSEINPSFVSLTCLDCITSQLYTVIN